MSNRFTNEEELALGRLARLDAQAATVRDELSRLRENLAVIRAEGFAESADSLKLANEKLLVAALDASTVADVAKDSLAALISSTQMDVLTNTPNGAVALDRLERAICKAAPSGSMIAVLFVDLDRLKLINDTLGHASGDAALQLAARRLESVVRSTGIVSRHGGDEFVVILGEVLEASDAGRAAEKILEVLSVPTQVGSQVLSITASIGISLFPSHASSAQGLIEAADSAMYVAKRRGGSAFEFYDPSPLLSNAGAPDLPVVGRADLMDSAQVEIMRAANSALVAATLAANELKDLAEEAFGKQIKFMAMVAHELRNPLAPIQIAADMLSTAGPDPALLKRLQGIIFDQVKQMVYLIEDLLDGSRVRTGKLRLELSPIDLLAVLQSNLEMITSRITERGQKIEVHLPTDPIIISGDRRRLAQVFANLLDNASKYTEQGGCIEVRADISDDNVIVSFTDDGVGIPADALTRIFDLFVQETGALKVHSGGLGVGLAVVREIVVAHAGTVVARSDGHDQGSTFTVSLPLNPGD